MIEWTDEATTAALDAKTIDCPEGLQYVLIRGLHAMGFAQASEEIWCLIRAALDAAVKVQEIPDDPILAYDDGHAEGYAAGMEAGRAEALEEAAKVAEQWESASAAARAIRNLIGRKG